MATLFQPMAQRAKCLFVCFFLLAGLKTDAAAQGSFQIIQSDALERLLEQHAEYNAGHGMMGYRIRIFRDNAATARQKAHEAKAKFMELYPDIRTYINYDNPYFKVTAGDFRSRDDALSLFVRVKQHFPKSFIVSERIRFPPLHNKYDDDE